MARMDYRPSSWLDQLVGACFGLLAAAVALYIAVRLIELVWVVLLLIGVVVAAVARRGRCCCAGGGRAGEADDSAEFDGSTHREDELFRSLSWN